VYYGQLSATNVTGPPLVDLCFVYSINRKTSLNWSRQWNIANYLHCLGENFFCRDLDQSERGLIWNSPKLLQYYHRQSFSQKASEQVTLLVKV
jgi:hypothetical protein